MPWINQPLNTYTQPNSIYFDGLYQKGLDLAGNVQTATNAIAALTIADPNFTGIDPTLTDPGSVTLPSFPTMPSAPTFTAVTAPADVTPPTLTLGLAVAYTDIAALISSMKTALTPIINDPTHAVEIALFSRAVDRETAAQSQGYQNYLDNQSSMGFASAPGQDQAIYAMFEKDKLEALSAINRDIMIASYQTAFDKLQGVLSSEIDAKKAAEGNDIDLYEAEADAKFNRIRTLGEVNRILIEQYKSQIDATIASGNLSAEQGKMLLAQVDAINSKNTMLTNIALEKIKVMDSHNIGKYNALSEGQKAIGATLGQLSATMFNTINYSQSWSQSINWSGSESVST